MERIEVVLDDVRRNLRKRHLFQSFTAWRHIYICLYLLVEHHAEKVRYQLLEIVKSKITHSDRVDFTFLVQALQRAPTI